MEGGERALPPQLHLHVDEEVPRPFDLPLQVHGAGVGVELPRAEVVVLVALRDADDYVVPRVRGGGPDAEDLSGDDDVGLEAEVVVGDSEGGVLTVQVVGTANPLTASARGGRDRRRRRRRSFIRAPDICETLGFTYVSDTLR